MRFVPDLSNNIGRRCAIRGTDQGRVWKLRTAMRDKAARRFYLCRNEITGEFRVVNTDNMSNLY